MWVNVRGTVKKIVLLAMCLCLFSACGEGPGSGRSAGPDAQGALYALERRTVGFEGSVQYWRYLAAVTEEGFLCAGVSEDGTQLCLRAIGDSEDGREFRVNPREDWGIELPDIYRVTSPAPGQLAFFAADGAGEGGKADPPKHYYVVRTDREGRLQKKTDLLPTMREKGIWESGNLSARIIECDVEGRLYLLDPKTQTAHFLDAEGGYITGYRFADEGGGRGELKCVKTDQGEVLVTRGEGGVWEFVRLDPQSGSAERIRTLELPDVREWYGMWGKLLYCKQGGKLAVWDPAAGETRFLYNLAANSVNLAHTYFLPSAEGGSLLAEKNGDAVLVKLSDREPESAGEILVANISGRDDFLQSGISAFSRQNGRYDIRYQDASREEGGRERILAEIQKGGGPDILYISRADMKRLWEEGALGDLDLLLSEETRAALYPAARGIGEMDGQAAGMPLYVTMDTFWTTGQYWQEESWSRGDILRILREHEELSGIIRDGSGRDGREADLRFFLGDDPLDSPYIRDGRADFDTEEFREFLAWMKKKSALRDSRNEPGRSEPGQSEPGEDRRFLRADGYLGVYRTLYDLNNYHNLLNWIGEDAHVVGLPSEDGRRIPLGVEGVLAVNRNAVDKPGVRELVNDLFGFETQRKCIGFLGMSVRSDMMERCIEYEDSSGKYGFREQDGTFIILSDGKDGPPCVAQYEALWRDAVYIEDPCGELPGIIIGGARAYFESEEDIDRAIARITERVQDYLDARR